MIVCMHAHLCLTLCDPVDCSPPCSSVHRIFQARVLEWVAISFSRGSSRPRDQTQVSRIVSKMLYHLSHQGNANLNISLSFRKPFHGSSLPCCCSVAQSCLIICHPMNCSKPGLPVHHQLPEFTQTHAHRVGDAIQPSHPLSSPSPPAPNPSQHQGLFQ